MRRNVSIVLPLSPLLALLLGAWGVGCGSEPASSPSADPPATPAGAPAAQRPAPPIPEPELPKYAGLYDVKGTTTEIETGNSRSVFGKLIIAQPGNTFTSTFDMQTMVVTPDGPLSAELIGSGTGLIGEGGVLVGVAESQLVSASSPGFHPRYPFGPGRVGPRVNSTFTMKPEPTGDYMIEIETVPAPGVEWVVTRTVLKARRARLGSE